MSDMRETVRELAERLGMCLDDGAVRIPGMDQGCTLGPDGERVWGTCDLVTYIDDIVDIGSERVAFAAYVRQQLSARGCFMEVYNVAVDSGFVRCRNTAYGHTVTVAYDGTALDEARAVCECALVMLRDREAGT